MSDTSMQDQILARLHQLPVLAAAVQEVIASFGNDDLDSTTLGRKIAQDQGLSAKVLRVANSSFYGLARKVGSIQDAVVVIGFNSVRSLALMAGMMGAFPPDPRSRFDRHAHWKRSFFVAGYAEALAQCLRQDRYLAFTAGMLHDIGQLVLDVCLPEQFSAMLEQQKISGCDLIEIEQSGLGLDHAQIGAELARRWNFPEAIEQSIRYWRTPDCGEAGPLAGLVHAAVLLESGVGGEDMTGQLPEVMHERLAKGGMRLADCLPRREQLDTLAELMLAA